MRLKDFIKTKDYIEVVESYPFAIRNLLSEAEANTITRKTCLLYTSDAADEP